MANGRKLKVGERYLNVCILGQVYVAVFPNKAKTKPEEPDYIGNGVSIWIKEKQPPKEQEEPQTRVMVAKTL